jgi:hypothetical protein
MLQIGDRVYYNSVAYIVIAILSATRYRISSLLRYGLERTVSEWEITR